MKKKKGEGGERERRCQGRGERMKKKKKKKGGGGGGKKLPGLGSLRFGITERRWKAASKPIEKVLVWEKMLGILYT